MQVVKNGKTRRFFRSCAFLLRVNTLMCIYVVSALMEKMLKRQKRNVRAQTTAKNDGKKSHQPKWKKRWKRTRQNRVGSKTATTGIATCLIAIVFTCNCIESCFLLRSLFAVKILWPRRTSFK